MTRRTSRKAVCFLSVALFLVVGGCWSSKGTPPVVPIDSASKKPEPPVVSQTLEQVRQEMSRFDNFSPEFDEGRLKMAVLQDKARREHGVEGFQQHEPPSTAEYTSPTAVADPKTHRVAWRALTCCNPQCTALGREGGPFLFSIEYSWITVGPDGKINVGAPNAAEMNRPVYCPVCKSNGYIRFYDTPETAVREKALRDELKSSYSAYAEASQAGRPMPADVRTPDQVVKEIESLPKVYLVSEPGKVKEFDAVTAPIGAGQATAPK